ncbi:MAG: EboA domain-containing protein [Acidiferrobacterales bacterium]|nr:EboA domain-containing protein [Acidiferrobacterales bacterium]
MSTSKEITILRNMVLNSLNEPQLAWFEKTRITIAKSSDPLNTLLEYSAEVNRQLGEATYRHTNDDPEIPNYLLHTNLTEAARVILAETAAELDLDKRIDVLSDFYRYGDEQEKASLLRGLSALDPDGNAVKIGINACRTNSLNIFKAIAIHNPYPSKHFPALNWNQMVLKSLFQNLNIDKISSLHQRQTSKLSNMCLSYVEEQLLAERDVPYSIWFAIKLKNVNEEGAELFVRFLKHEDDEQRFTVARSLSLQQLENDLPQALIKAVTKRQQCESDARVLKELKSIAIKSKPPA